MTNGRDGDRSGRRQTPRGRVSAPRANGNTGASGRKPPRPARSGPRQPRRRRRTPWIYWRNRLIALAILGVIALIVYVGWRLGAALVDAHESAPQGDQVASQADEATSGEAPSTAEADSVVECTRGMLVPTVSADAATAEEGTPVKVTLDLATVEMKEVCHLTVTPTKLGLRVVTGEEVVYDSFACAEDKPKSLLLGRDLTWSTSFTWDGAVHGDSCTVTGPAKPGTYVLHVVYDGEDLGNPVPLTVTERPSAKPEQPDEGQGEDSGEGRSDQ